MKRTLRFNCFETNSSSMHTVTVRGKRKINEDWIKDYGVIHVVIDEYGWSGYPCDDFMSKLAYAMAMVLMTEYPGFSCWDEVFTLDQDTLKSLAGYNTILDAINLHSKCEEIVIEKNTASYYPYGYIDHQSCKYSSLQDFLADWNVDAERFLFDDDVIVWIDNDNH